MRSMEVTLSAIVMVMVSCVSSPRFDDVVGQYQTTELPGVSLAELELRADSSYDETFIFAEGDTIRHTGRWSWYENSGHTNITLWNALVPMSDPNAPATSLVHTEAYGLRVRGSLDGGLYIVINPDYDISLVKSRE